MENDNQQNRDNANRPPKTKPTPEESKAALDALTSKVASTSFFGIDKPTSGPEKLDNAKLAEFMKLAEPHHDTNMPETPDLLASTPAPAPAQQPEDFAIANDTPASPAPATAAVAAPAPAPSADLEQPAAPESDELATVASKRPLAHFGQALPATKSKANRKLVLQLTPEEYQFLALVVALPDMNGVAMPDLARAVLKAWRDDYRPDIKKSALAAFKV